MKEYHELPQPEDISIEEREDAMGGYLMMFAALAAGLPLPMLNMIAAVIYYYVNKKKSKFVHFHVAQSVLSQIPTSLLNGVLVFWTIRTFFGDRNFTDNFKGYALAVLVANLAYIGFSIYAAIKARKGEMYYFLLFGRISYNIAFRVRDDERIPKKAINLPPK